ncbi:hypothetical protein TcWFU_002365 [Taenia crassiceps]|uniref:Uncharacterized protein n=1 Tax=Taenia crassiceps TaxID=6207 RepID=A0ABR4QA84_9CEST
MFVRVLVDKSPSQPSLGGASQMNGSGGCAAHQSLSAQPPQRGRPDEAWNRAPHAALEWGYTVTSRLTTSPHICGALIDPINFQLSHFIWHVP